MTSNKKCYYFECLIIPLVLFDHFNMKATRVSSNLFDKTQPVIFKERKGKTITLSRYEIFGDWIKSDYLLERIVTIHTLLDTT